jgi:hypothetical protein
MTAMAWWTTSTGMIFTTTTRTPGMTTFTAPTAQAPVGLQAPLVNYLLNQQIGFIYQDLNEWKKGGQYMGTKSVNLSSWIIILACFAFLNLGFAGNSYCQNDSDPHMTGLPELTQEELEWQNKHMIRVKKVKLNKIGLERINNWRKQKAEDLLTEDEAVVVKKGKEVEGTVGEPIAEESEGNTAVALPQIELPSYIDNSSLKFFPPIRSQGSLPSCGVFSGTYYAMTYMHALAHDLDVKNGGNSYIFSPKWTYNMVIGGGINGTW